MLLFLKNVEKIQTYHWPSTEAQPILLHTTEISTSSALRKKRSFVLTSKLTNKPQINDYAMEICDDKGGNETWVVCNQLGGGRATRMASNEGTMH